MSTPPRLVELSCPNCNAVHWEIDSDEGMFPDGEFAPPYPERPYTCPACAFDGPGYATGEMSPVEFLMQPHSLYPMYSEEFDRWVEVMRREFPDHPMLADLGKRWHPVDRYPNLRVRPFWRRF